MRTARQGSIFAGCAFVWAGETVFLGDIQSEPSAGPEVGTMDGILNDCVPPPLTPLLGSFSLLPGLPDGAHGILDDLVCADRALPRVLGLVVFAKDGLKRQESGEYGQAHCHGRKHQAEPSEHEHREGDGQDDGEHRAAVGRADKSQRGEPDKDPRDRHLAVADQGENHDAHQMRSDHART